MAFTVVDAWDFRGADSDVIKRTSRIGGLVLSVQGDPTFSGAGLACDAAGDGLYVTLPSELRFTGPYFIICGQRRLGAVGDYCGTFGYAWSNPDTQPYFVAAHFLNNGANSGRIIGENEGSEASGSSVLEGLPPDDADSAFVIKKGPTTTSLLEAATPISSYSNDNDSTFSSTSSLFVGAQPSSTVNPNTRYHWLIVGSGDISTEEIEAILADPDAFIYSTEPALSIDEQPTDTQSGYLIDPAPVVHVLDDEGALDPSFTGNVTASLLGSGGVLLGTTTVAAVAGVATFSNLRPCEAGTYQLRFSASGYANLDSATFAVTAGEGTTILGAPMFQSLPIPQNEGTASRRRIYLDIRNDSNGAWDGSVSGVKAKLTKGGVLVEGVETDSPADIVRVAGRLHYVEVAQAYVNDTVGVAITARVPAAAGRQEAVSVASIIPGDSYAAGLTQSGIIIALMRAMSGLDGWGMEVDEESGVCRLVIPGVGTQEISAQFGARLQSLLRLGTAPS